MIYRKISLFLSIFFGLLMCVSFFCSCSNKDLNLEEGFVVRDLSGRTTKFDSVAQKVVALTASDCEVISALGCSDRIIGRGTYCDYPESIKEVCDVGSGNMINIESIIAMQPDCVFISKMAQTVDQVSALEDAGIKVISNQPDNLDDTYSYIKIIGAVLGKSEVANTIVNDMQTEFIALHSQATENLSKFNISVFFESSPLEYGLWACGSNTFMHEIGEILTLNNIFSDESGWLQVAQEQVINRNPNFICALKLNDSSFSSEDILTRQNWGEIDAIKENRVFVVDSNIIARPGPRLAEGAYSIYQYLIQQYSA